ncbi:MAG: sugar transferase [Pseudomonadota bacterium]
MSAIASTELTVASRKSNRAFAQSLHIVHSPADYRFRLVRTPIGGGAKRAFDLVAASSALVVLGPALLLIALLVRLDSKGPALFRQRRTGFRGRSFQVLKFRTMRQTDDGAVVRQAQRNDPRVTRLGAFLRKTSLDELPQLINVVAGDMSLVGPRPHAVPHDHIFSGVDRDYAARFVARPGITGLAQVRGERGLSDTSEKIKARLRFDLNYVQDWSMQKDITILVSTVRVLLHDPNAF